MIWLLIALKIEWPLRALFVASVCAILITGCEKFDVVEKSPEPLPWWQPLVADVTIGPDKFYARDCSITQVKTSNGIPSADVIFKVPNGFLTSCTQSEGDGGALTYDGEYIILSVCKIAFGAGGCSGGRYRSADFEHWQEYIGVTWVRGEEYEAWRKLGSTSAKADFVKKVVK